MKDRGGRWRSQERGRGSELSHVVMFGERFPDSCGPDNFDWPVITQLNIQETVVNRLYETSDYNIIYSTRSSEHFLTPSTCKLGEHPSTQTSWGITCPTSHNKARRHGARMGYIRRRLRCVFVYFIEDLDTFASTKEASNNMYDGVVYLILFFHYLVCI